MLGPYPREISSLDCSYSYLERNKKMKLTLFQQMP